MRFPNRETVERVRREYPKGTRVELVRMDDAQAPPIGTHGTVLGVDDTASLMVAWDNGSHLNVVYGEDAVAKVIVTECYSQRDEWSDRRAAENFFLKAMMNSEGSEQQRYTSIYLQLQNGLFFCTDKED